MLGKMSLGRSSFTHQSDTKLTDPLFGKLYMYNLAVQFQGSAGDSNVGASLRIC